MNGTDWNDFIAKVLAQIWPGAWLDQRGHRGCAADGADELSIPLDDYVTRDAILKSPAKKDLAWEVLKFMVQKDTFDVVWPGNVTTPARKSLMTADRYASTGPMNWSVFYDTLTNHPDTAPIPAPPYYNALATVLNHRTSQALSSGNAKAALDAMQADLEKLAGS